MADLFLFHSRADRRNIEPIVAAIEAEGRSVAWFAEEPRGAERARRIEAEIEEARCVLLAWTRDTRESLWMRGVASAALDRGKLVQINLDGARPPAPFGALHPLNFSGWRGSREQMPWPHLWRRIEERTGSVEPRAIDRADESEPALQGFGRAAGLGTGALVLAVLMALVVLLTARDLIQADLFAILSVAALAVSAVLLAACLFVIVRVERASRR